MGPLRPTQMTTSMSHPVPWSRYSSFSFLVSYNHGILSQGPYRHYILNVLWILINMLCMLLIVKQLHRLRKEFNDKNIKVSIVLSGRSSEPDCSLCSGDCPQVWLWSQEAGVSPGRAGREGRGHQGQDLLRHLVLLHPVLGPAVYRHPGQLELGVEGCQELSVTRGGLTQSED